MEPVTAAALRALMQGLGERCSQPATLYLLGGSALCLLGSPRQTLDLDYTVEIAPEGEHEFLEVLADLAATLHIDLEDVPINQFVPLPSNPAERRRLIGRFGAITVDIDPRDFRAYFAEIRRQMKG